MLDHDDRRTLLAIARHVIEQAFSRHLSQPVTQNNSPALYEPRASFVTLKCHGQLRGCIGTLEAVRRLCDDVAYNARAAAFRDPRFPPLDGPETAYLHIEVSVLEQPEVLAVENRSELLDRLRPGEDGLIVEAGSRRATFLPSVWESLSDPDEFVIHLWKKAGLAPDIWPGGVRLMRYGAEHFDESEMNRCN